MQYTIRFVPEQIDRELRRLAKQQNKSLNTVVVETLRRGLEMTAAEPARHHDLDWLIGTWEDDPEFDAAVTKFRELDDMTMPPDNVSKTEN